MTNDRSLSLVKSGLPYFALISFSLFLAPASVAAQSTEPSALAPAKTPHQLLADEMTELYMPADQIMTAAAKSVEDSFRLGASTNTELQRLDVYYPGLIETGANYTRLFYQRHYPAKIADMQSALASYFATNFTSQDLKEMIAFYRSGVGANTFTQSLDTTNFDAFRARVIRTGDPLLTKSDITNSIRVEDTLARLTPAERSAFSRFANSLTAKKFTAHTSSFQTIILNKTNVATTELLPLLRNEIQTALTDHIQTYSGKK